MWLGSGFFIVQEGQVAVLTQFGKYKSTAQAGFQWRIPGPAFEMMETTYFASRETIIAGHHRGMPVWRDKLFALMHRNAAPATGFFRIPGNRLVELGAQVEI